MFKFIYITYIMEKSWIIFIHISCIHALLRVRVHLDRVHIAVVLIWVVIGIFAVLMTSEALFDLLTLWEILWLPGGLILTIDILIILVSI